MPDARSKWERFLRPWAGSSGAAGVAAGRFGVGVGVLLIALLAVRLGVPRAVAPREVPLPRPNATAVSLPADAWRSVLSSAELHPLPSAVRAVGELVRRIGLSEANRDSESLVHERRLLRVQVARALEAEGPEPLLALRDLQTALFRRALARWDSGSAPVELLELGGSFTARFEDAQSGPAFAPSELDAVYRTRWTNLVGLEQHVRFAPTLDDYRGAARLKLRWADQLPAAERLPARLQTIEQLGQLDQSYPAHYALGVTWFLAGDYSESLAAFRAHLAQHPDGEWTLRARNHQLAAARAIVGDGNE